MPMSGMDVEAILGVSKRLKAQATELQGCTRTVDQVIQVATSAWRGPDVDEFGRQWSARLRHTMLRAAHDLETLGEEARRNAEAQRETSATLDGACGSGGTSTGMPWPFGDSDEEKERNKSGGPLTPVEGDLPMTDSDLAPENLRQGGIGDCSLISAMGVVAAADPDWIRQHMVRNADGSYTVTLYEQSVLPWNDHDPVEVTVPAEHFENGVKDANGNPSWASVNEAAVAQHRGGTPSDIWSLNPADCLEWMTGQESRTERDPSLDSIQQGQADGRVYVVGSNDDEDDEDHTPNENVVANHAYMVVEVTDHNGQQMVHLQNPWGTGASPDQRDLWMTEAEFHENFGSVNSVEMKG